MSKRWHYLHGHSSNEGFTKDGVSDKLFPVPVEWRRPKSVKNQLPFPFSVRVQPDASFRLKCLNVTILNCSKMVRKIVKGSSLISLC